MQRMLKGILDDKGSNVWSVGPEETALSALETMAEHNRTIPRVRGVLFGAAGPRNGPAAERRRIR